MTTTEQTAQVLAHALATTLADYTDAELRDDHAAAARLFRRLCELRQRSAINGRIAINNLMRKAVG